ncbi:hypothetical protein FBU31_002441, partial [Coemansia sp. 'formosensis']
MPDLAPYLRGKPRCPRPAAPLSNNPYTRKTQIRNANCTEEENELRKSKGREKERKRRERLLTKSAAEQAANKARKAEYYHKSTAKIKSKNKQLRSELLAEQTSAAPPIAKAAFPKSSIFAAATAPPIAKAAFPKSPIFAAATAPPIAKAALSKSPIFAAATAPPIAKAALSKSPIFAAATAPPIAKAALSKSPIVAAAAAPPIAQFRLLGPKITYKRAEYRSDMSEAAQKKRRRERLGYAERQSNIDALPKAECEELKAERVLYFGEQYIRRTAGMSQEERAANNLKAAARAKRRRDKRLASAAAQRDSDLHALDLNIPVPSDCGENPVRVFYFNSRKASMDKSLNGVCHRIKAGFGPKIVAISESYLDIKPALYGWSFLHTQEYSDGSTRKSMARIVVGYDNRALGEWIVGSRTTDHTISLFVRGPSSTTPVLQLLFAYLPPFNGKSNRAVSKTATGEMVAEIVRAEYPLIVMGDLNARMGPDVGDLESCARGDTLLQLTKDRG